MKMHKNYEVVWLNGTLVKTDNARIAPDDRGFLLGDGLFETMLVFKGQVPSMALHLDRLANGCDVLRFPTPDRPLLESAINDVLAANDLCEGVIRLTVSRGTGPRGVLPGNEVTPTVLVRCAPKGRRIERVRLALSRYRRDGTSPLTKIKSLNYLPSVMARMEAEAAGYDDALLPGLNDAGVEDIIAEASAANIIFSNSEGLTTPLVEDGALPGISRGRLIKAGLIKARRTRFHELHEIRAAWLVTALALVPVVSIGEISFAGNEQEERQLHDFLFEEENH